MPVLGITGGIGMGKSTAAGILVSLGIPVVDTDQLAREETTPGSPALAEIRERLGSEFVDASGVLDRSRLAGVVFSDPSRRGILEEILHPRIALRWQQAAASWRGEGVTGAVVIPLLFEKSYETQFEFVVAVACSAETQQQRLEARGWSPGEIEGRKAAQLPVPEKISRSQVMIWTEGSVQSHRDQWSRILGSRLGAV
jgi:dephospho-CoA kinase